MKSLKSLASVLKEAVLIGSPETEIVSMSSDSRKISPGSLFIALPGHRVDGAFFAEKAVEAGAVAVLTERKLEIPSSQIIVPDVHKAMEVIVPYFYDYPGKALRIIGITGTNGKTTTSFLIHHLLQEAGKKSGLIGTICSKFGNQEIISSNTTPDVADLQKLLYEMVKGGLSHVVMEVSSHALALGRVAGCEFDVGVFTNLTQDHLDFHRTFEEYQEAKLRLFSSLGENGCKSNKRAVINRDDEQWKSFAENSEAPVWTYGYQVGSDFFVRSAEISQEGTEISLSMPDGELTLRSTLVGDFNVSNILAAIVAVHSEGLSWDVIESGLASFSGVPGRFQQISNNPRLPLVVVDYAHTPDGLKNVLLTARKLVKEKLVVVFGCGGDRDRLKRPLMGAIGAELADEVILTSDNPRNEEPEAILQDILVAWDDCIKKPMVISDREKAIRKAIEVAEPGDVVLISGKGHETYQILKDEVIHFDDREVAEKALEEKYGIV